MSWHGNHLCNYDAAELWHFRINDMILLYIASVVCINVSIDYYCNIGAVFEIIKILANKCLHILEVAHTDSIYFVHDYFPDVCLQTSVFTRATPLKFFVHSCDNCDWHLDIAKKHKCMFLGCVNTWFSILQILTIAPQLFVGKSHENGYTAECVTPRSFMLILSVRTTPSYLFDLPHSLSLSALMTVGSLILWSHCLDCYNAINNICVKGCFTTLITRWSYRTNCPLLP